MAGLIIFDPDDDFVGLTTGDDVALNSYLDIENDTLYFTDGLTIYEWEGDETGYRQTYVWKSGEIRMPYPVNMGAALVEAETYSETVGLVVGDDFWNTTVFASNWTGVVDATSDIEDARSVSGSFFGTADINNLAWFGTTSLNLLGASDYVTYGSTQADYDAYQMSNTDDFTIDGFFYLKGALSFEEVQGLVVSAAASSAVNFQLVLYSTNPDLELMVGNVKSNASLSGPGVQLNTWNYFNVQRRYNSGSPIVDFYYGNAAQGFVNRQAQIANAGSPETVNGPLHIGSSVNETTGAPEGFWDGRLDAIRVTKSARNPTAPASINVPSTWYTQQSNPGATYNITFRLYADGVLKHTQVVTDDEPFRLPGGYLSNIYTVELEGQLPITRVSVTENILELAEG
jgi:hypothetical protein